MIFSVHFWLLGKYVYSSPWQTVTRKEKYKASELLLELAWKLKTSQFSSHSVSQDSFSRSYPAVKMVGLVKLKLILLLKGRVVVDGSRSVWSGVGRTSSTSHRQASWCMIQQLSHVNLFLLFFSTINNMWILPYISSPPCSKKAPDDPSSQSRHKIFRGKKGYSFCRILYQEWFNLTQTSTGRDSHRVTCPLMNP